jgi:Fe-S-cluster containining protein
MNTRFMKPALLPGLQFECQPGCTNCCQVQGFVYLTEQDLEQAAEFTGMSKRAFLRRFVYRTKNFLRLRKPRNSQCHFLVEGGCSLHPAKPTQCRLFPFWPELVEQRAEWNKTARHCPGIGKGALIQIGTALETAGGMRRAYPAMYE